MIDILSYLESSKDPTMVGFRENIFNIKFSEGWKMLILIVVFAKSNLKLAFSSKFSGKYFIYMFFQLL